MIPEVGTSLRSLDERIRVPESIHILRLRPIELRFCDKSTDTQRNVRKEDEEDRGDNHDKRELLFLLLPWPRFPFKLSIIRSTDNVLPGVSRTSTACTDAI